MRSDEWTTPPKLYDWLHKKCKFNVDAAATEKNTKCKKFFSKKNSFLECASKEAKASWRIFVNPPYSMDSLFANLCYFLYKYSGIHSGIPSVILLPVRSDRIWYNRLSNLSGVRVIPFTGRIHFGNAKGGAFMYSVLFVIGFKDVDFPKYLDAGQFNKNGKGSATT